MAAYQVENKLEDNTSWNTGGTWILGNRKDQYLTKINISSNNSGESFIGTVAYNDGKLLNFRARLDIDNMYRAEIRSRDSINSWQSDGIWVIGNRKKQRCTELNISSGNGENILVGTVKYEGEDKIDFKGNYISSYSIENHWGKDTAPWHFGGVWVLSSRINQKVRAIDIISEDDGESFSGSIQYSGEEMKFLKAKRILGNNYEVYNKCGSGTSSWYRCGDMIIGGRDNQRVIKLEFNSDNKGNDLYGNMIYEDESTIGFRASLIEQIE